MKKNYLKVFAALALWITAAPNVLAQNVFKVENKGTEYTVTLPVEKDWQLVKKGDFYGVKSQNTATTRAEESFNVKAKGLCIPNGMAARVVLFNKDRIFNADIYYHFIRRCLDSKYKC